MYLDAMMSVVRREIARTMHKYHNPPRAGMVSSFDKKTHRVKVQWQPEGTESGWIPLTGTAVGNGYGIASAPNVGDTVEVHNQESNHMVARVMARHWSTENKPPQLEAGEHVMIHQNGSQVYFKKDGTVRIAGSGDVQTSQNSWKSGNTTTQQNGTSAQKNQNQKQQSQQAKNWIQLNPDGTIVIESDKADITIQAKATDINIESDTGNIYLITPSKKTNAVASKTATTKAVMLDGGGLAKTLFAEPA